MPRSLARLIGGDAAVPDAARAIEIAGITEDSRKVKRGDLFFAISGHTTDGAQFIASAVQNGAAAIVCEIGKSVAGAACIETRAPRLLLAKVAARFYAEQPDTIVAVTGTNGKTSVASFVRQIWTEMGFRAASYGTVGLVSPSGTKESNLTSPDPVMLHQDLAALAEDKVQHLAIEASSIGLEQYRMHGLRLAAGGFTNFTQDHLDIHGTMEAYFNAKMILFEDLLQPGAAAVINMDAPQGSDVLRRAQARGLNCFTVGSAGSDIRLVSATSEGLGQVLRIETRTGLHEVPLPLAGDFQVSNALVAAGLVIASGGEESITLHALASLKGAAGRLDLVGSTADGAPIFVDYAHTPDALENVLSTVRPLTKGKLHVVFGCGGDRDGKKRPLMAQAASSLADIVYVTDDNPRTENAAEIRKQVMAGAPHAREIADRAVAIKEAVSSLKSGDALVVAGKGHEDYQIIGKTKFKFSDHDAVRHALEGKDYRV
jgi:UDP-N-acetylmuramoyl-L-alanyl-D-glutamate--2,6-diaminopimelate ligase